MINEHNRNHRVYPMRRPNTSVPAVECLPGGKMANVSDGWESLDTPDAIVAKPLHNYGPYGDYSSDKLGVIESDRPGGSGYGGLYPEKDDKDAAGMYYYLFNDNETPKYAWVIPGVLAGGRHPIYSSMQDNLDYLRKAGIKAIVSAFESAIDSKHLDGFEYYFIPTLDRTTNHLWEAAEFIDEMEKQGKPVFVHCFGGTGRTSTCIAAYFIYKGYLTADESIKYLRLNYKEGAVETTYQEDELRKFEQRLKRLNII